MKATKKKCIGVRKDGIEGQNEEVISDEISRFPTIEALDAWIEDNRKLPNVLNISILPKEQFALLDDGLILTNFWDFEYSFARRLDNGQVTQREHHQRILLSIFENSLRADPKKFDQIIAAMKLLPPNRIKYFLCQYSKKKMKVDPYVMREESKIKIANFIRESLDQKSLDAFLRVNYWLLRYIDSDDLSLYAMAFQKGMSLHILPDHKINDTMIVCYMENLGGSHTSSVARIPRVMLTKAHLEILIRRGILPTNLPKSILKILEYSRMGRPPQ